VHHERRAFLRVGSLVFTLGLVMLGGSMVPQAQTRATDPAKSAVDQEVTSASNRWYDAISRGDVTALEAVETDDFLTFQQLPQGLTVISKKAQLEALRKSNPGSRLSVERTLEGVMVRQYGTAAVLTAVATFRGKDAKGAPIVAKNVVTEVWVREGGRWRVGHFQSMRVPPTTSAATPAK